jgi:protein associated with RNAse G/E
MIKVVTLFRDVTLCSLEVVHRCFEMKYYFHNQGRNVKQESNQKNTYEKQRMALYSFEMSVNLYQNTRYHMSDLRIYRYENLKSQHTSHQVISVLKSRVQEYCHMILVWLYTGFESVIGFIELVTISKVYAVTVLHTSQISVGHTSKTFSVC